MNEDNYGCKYKDHLLEQYKIYVEMADRTSERRIKINNFYISIFSIYFGILSIVKNNNYVKFNNYIIYAILFLAILYCINWYTNINSYKQLNKAKYELINEIEKELPFDYYTREWKLLQPDESKKKYVHLSTVEKFIPFLILILIIIMILIMA